MKRRGFIVSTTALAAAAFLRDVALGAEGTTMAGELAPVVETLLPFGTPGFPDVASAEVVGRIDAIFKLSTDPIFAGSLHGFSDVASFPTGTDRLFAAESTFAPGIDIKELAKHDAATFDSSGLSLRETFGTLTPADRARYVHLWSQSGFIVRRRFYGSVRAVAFVAFYSMPEAWAAIGYGGALLHSADRA